jgi:outer membrane receptor protein involved in Fe transport
MDAVDLATDSEVGRFWNLLSPADTQEYAAFANVKVNITDALDVQFGARETYSKATALAAFESGPAISVLGFAPPFTPAATSTADNFTYMASPAYHITPDVMTYFRVATGFRPPSPNIPSAVAQGAPPTVNPDATTDYEVGIKGDFFEHALTIEAAVYRIDWSDIQLQLQTNAGAGSFVYNGNGSGARSQGFEVNAVARPTDSLSLSGWLSYDSAKLTEDFAYGLAGDQLPNVPQFSAHASAQQFFKLSPSWTGYAGGDVTYIGQETGVFNSTVVGGNGPRQIYPAYTKVDLRLGARTDMWRVELYATNVNNSHGELNGGLNYEQAPNSGLPTFVEITPRTFGFSVVREF